MTAQEPSDGAVQLSRPSATLPVRSCTDARSRPVSLRVELAGLTRAACTSRSFWAVTVAAGAIAGAGTGPSYVAPAATVAEPYASSLTAAGLSGVMVGTAAGQAGPIVRSMVTPRR